MPLLSISYVNFRNIQNETLDLNSREVFFVGENGQGKSNLLESVYYLAYGSSFRTRSDAEIIRSGESAFSLRTLFRKWEDDADSVFISLESSGAAKKIVKNGKSIKDRKELVNTMPCVLFCHDDLEFAVGEPERRRFFVDQCLSMFDMYYIDLSRNYRKVLKSRYLSLKQQQYGMLDVYDLQLCEFGLQIQKKRNDAIFRFNQIFATLYERITGIDNVSIRYAPSWRTDSAAIPQKEEVMEILSGKRDADRAKATTMSGPHRDRIKFVRNGADFVATASTGQRRLLAILLRVSQSIFYKQATGKNPILLMDDVLLELDPEKRQHVTALLPDYDQLFCTFLPGEPYERYAKSSTRVYKIENGGWNEIQKRQ